MFKLKIKKPDGDFYWVEHFNSREDLGKWLYEEQTRPYWKHDFTTEVEDLTPPPKSQEQIDAENAVIAEAEATRQFLKGLKKSDLKTVADCSEAIMKIIKHLRADK